MTAHLSVISLWAEDVQIAAHFYKDVLELPMPAHHAGTPHFELDGINLVILHGVPVPARDAHPERFPLFALTIDDFDAALKRLAAHQIALPWGIEHNSGSRWVMFYDPAGNLIELVDQHVEMSIARDS
jgi:catechol-2,3-dioxygenase